MNVTPKPNWAITQFGGKDSTSYSNIFFRYITSSNLFYSWLVCGILVICSNGQLDPWSAGGVLETLTDDLPAVVIPNAAHHLDLRARNDADTLGVIHARQKELDFIEKLLHM